jgi:tetratricopeptide (TPR) repeat protein
MELISEEEIQRLLKSAKDLIKEGNIDDSIDALIAILNHDPEHQECNSLLGALLLSNEQNTMADGFLYTAAALSNWTDTVSIVNLAESLKQKNDSELSLKVLFKGLKAVNSSDPSGLLFNAIGDVLFARKNFSAAADNFLMSAFRRPLREEGWVKASTMLFPPEGKDYVFAENVLVEAVRINPNSSQLVFQLGVVMHFTERFLLNINKITLITTYLNWIDLNSFFFLFNYLLFILFLIIFLLFLLYLNAY